MVRTTHLALLLATYGQAKTGAAKSTDVQFGVTSSLSSVF
jgi:hypothetical protein